MHLKAKYFFTQNQFHKQKMRNILFMWKWQRQNFNLTTKAYFSKTCHIGYTCNLTNVYLYLYNDKTSHIGYTCALTNRQSFCQQLCSSPSTDFQRQPSFLYFLFFQMMQRQKANKLFSHPGHKIPKMFKLCFAGYATRSC